MAIVTLRERKAAKVAAIKAGVEKLAPVLAAYAREHGGRFILYGSAARGDVRYDSDVDILIDFPIEKESSARNFAEDECHKRHLPADVLSFWMVGERLRERAEAEGRVLA